MVSSHDPVFTFFNLRIMCYSTDFRSISTGCEFLRPKSQKLKSWFVYCYGFVRQNVYHHNQVISNFYYFDRRLRWNFSRLVLEFRVLRYFVHFRSSQHSHFWAFHSSVSALQENCSALRNVFRRSVVQTIPNSCSGGARIYISQ